MTTFATMTPPISVSGYRATRLADGTLVFHAVPIFCECSRGKMVFDADWIGEAIHHAQTSEREGYFPPLHIRHHKDGGEVKASGFFRVTGAGPITFKGKQVQAVFADLHITDPATADKVLRKQLPYRSIEIFDVDSPAINGLALLDHEAPHLELPMLMVNSVAERQGESETKSPWTMQGAAAVDTPVVALFRRGRSALALFGAQMDDEKKPHPEPDADDKPQAPPAANDADADNKPEVKEQAAPQETPGEGVESEWDIQGLCKAIIDGNITIAELGALMAAINERETKTHGGGAPAPAAAPGESMRAGAPEPTTGKADTGNAVQFAAMQAEIDTLKATLAAATEEKARVADVAAAMKRLAGRPLGADLEERLTKFRAFGAAPFASYVETLEKMAPAAPTPDAGKMAAFAAQSAGITGPVAGPVKLGKAVEAYSKDGPDAVAKALNFSRQWAELNATGHARMPEDRFIATMMALEQAKN